MLRYSLAALALAALVGCETSVDPMARSEKVDRTQLAASAATAQYPQDKQASDDMRLMSLLDRDNKTIRILNPSDQVLRDVRVWVNGEFVQHVDSVPAHGTVTLRRQDFYNRSGVSMNLGNITVNRLELQIGENLHRIYGPVYE